MNYIDTTLSLLAPHICVSCNAEGDVLCKSCALSLPTLPSICYLCARATKDYHPCAAHHKAYSPQRVFMSAEYKDEIKRLIQVYKFDYKRAAAKDIAYFLYNTLPYFEQDTVMTFVPTTGVHIRERGFDHTRLITKELRRLNKLPYEQMLTRMTSTTQKGSNRQQRKKQLEGAFRTVTKDIRGKKVLLIDDVITTGATIEICTKLLLTAGAARVDVAAVARTP